MLTRRSAIVSAALPLLSGCASAVYVASYEAASTSVGPTTGLDAQDIDDLRSGHLERVRQRYAGRDPGSLTPKQLLLMSDIYLKYGEFGKAQTFLALYQRRTGDHSSAVAGTQALIALALGNPTTAASLTSGADDDGSRYVHALASARLGQNAAARAAARRFALSFDPKLVYFAANLYSAVGDNKAALDLLQDPSRRLLRDYGVSALPTLFGQGKTAPFRLDVFDEFTIGWFNVYSYAPAANVYVEYLAAHSLLELGQTQESVRHLDALLAYSGLPAYRDVAWLVLYDCGRAAQRLGQTGEAQRYFQGSIDDIESMRRSVSSDQGRIGFAADKQAVYAAMVGLLLAAGQVGPALSYSERARSRSLVDLLASRDDIVPRELSAGRSAALLDRLDLAEGQATLAAAAPDPAAALRASDFTAVRRDIADRAPSLAPLISVTPIPIDTIRGAVAPDETAIAFYRTGSGWTAFVIGRGQVASVPLNLGDANQLVLGLLRSVTSAQDTMAHCRAAYDALIGPLRGSIQTKRLLLVPFGILHYVPFAALHDGNGHLIETFSIRQVPSLSALVIAERTPAGGSGSLVIGNPLRSGDAPSLPSAQAEAELVGTLLPNPTVLIGGAATLDAFRRDAPGKAYLHIASHGEFNSTNPLGSRLLLAADPGDTGDLTVGALYSIRLGARLVTLSACETAVSELSDGDDLVGLVRGFLFAGAENVIATLWEISDRATSTLMGGFYRSLRTTQSVPESLRQAQIETMKTYAQPFYWAAFVPTSFAPRVAFA